jgi:hypothetical protein
LKYCVRILYYERADVKHRRQDTRGIL